MDKYECSICGYVYDPEAGDPDNGIDPGTSFDDLPDDWTCPLCGSGKAQFELKEQKQVAPAAAVAVEKKDLDDYLSEWRRTGDEVEGQLAIIKGLNCRYGQGFLFSPALPAPDLETLLLEWQYGKISRK